MPLLKKAVIGEKKNTASRIKPTYLLYLSLNVKSKAIKLLEETIKKTHKSFFSLS